MGSRGPVRRNVRDANGGRVFHDSALIGQGEREQAVRSVLGGSNSNFPKNAVEITNCLALAAMSICAVVATVFFGIHVFYNHHHEKGDQGIPGINGTDGVNGSDPVCIEQIITSNTSALIQPIVLDLGDVCDPFETTTWRLHRVCNTVHFGFQGFCRNSKERDDNLSLDLSMVNFPIDVGTPSPNLERYDVSGVGSILVEGRNIAGIIEVDGDESNQRYIDVDIRLSDDFEEVDTIEIAFLCIYEVFTPPL
jgi:hypothetical protein